VKLGNISVSYIDIVIKAMQQIGCDIDDILLSFSLNSVTLSSPDAKVSIPKFMRLGHVCIQKSHMPWLGLLMGQVTSPTNLGIAGLLAITAHDLKQACQQLTDYETLNQYNVRGQSRFYVNHSKFRDKRNNFANLRKGQGIVTFYSLKPYNDYNYFVVDSVLSGWYQVIQRLTGRDDAVDKVCFEFSAPKYAAKYADYFNCEVLFDQPNNYLVIKPSALTWPCLERCKSTFEMLKRQADSDLEKVRLGISFTEKVERVIGPLLDGSTPTLDQVALQLNVAPWTVRRKLVEEGSSFQQTLNDTRRDLSISYVSDTALTLGEIAYLLGFGSSAAFQRAFKRWTGIAPGRYRQLTERCD